MRGLGSHAGPVSLIHPRKENVKNLKIFKLKKISHSRKISLNGLPLLFYSQLYPDQHLSHQ